MNFPLMQLYLMTLIVLTLLRSFKKKEMALQRTQNELGGSFDG